jgi:hypothetical protein
MSAAGRLLLACWCLIVVTTIFSVLFPRMLKLILYWDFIRFFLLPLVLFSVAYGVYSLFRQGMKRTHREQSEPPSEPRN